MSTATAETMTVPADPPAPVSHEWQEVRCHHCRKLLCKVTDRDALKANHRLQFKCTGCNSISYMTGRPA